MSLNICNSILVLKHLNWRIWLLAPCLLKHRWVTRLDMQHPILDLLSLVKDNWLDTLLVKDHSATSDKVDFEQSFMIRPSFSRTFDGFPPADSKLNFTAVMYGSAIRINAIHLIKQLQPSGRKNLQTSKQNNTYISLGKIPLIDCA